MINKQQLLWLSKQSLLYYVEMTGHNDEGAPIYEVKKGWYLRSYGRKYNEKTTITNIITMSEHIDCSVVRHVPNSRCFTDEEATNEYITKLKNGEIEYDRY